jgi:ribose transport system substrate-binding protein
MKWQRVLICSVLAVSLLAFPACRSGSSGSGKVRVAFVSNNPADFWTIVEAGCRKAEQETGVEVVFRKPPPGDSSKQKEILDDLVNQSIKAVAVSVIDPKSQRAHLNEIAERIPLLTQDNDAPDSKRLGYIGTNNYEAGRAVGKLVKEALPEGGTIAIFVGQLEPLNARQRRQGTLDELAGTPAPPNINEFIPNKDGEMYGKYRLFKTYTDDGQEDKASKNATDALTQLREEKKLCMIGLWAYNPPAILTAVKDQSRQGEVKIIGFDENFTTLKGIADGHIHATVVQDPFNFGYEGTKMLAALSKGDKSVLPKDGIRYVPHQIIAKEAGKDRRAVAEFRAELEKNLGKQ